jgi:hypothetical protein
MSTTKSVADLPYIHPSLRIPSPAVNYLLPDASLSVLEFLEFKLPVISSSKVLAPAKFFSKLEPTITQTDLLCGIAMPSEETLAALGAACKSAVKSGAASVLCPHVPTPLEKCLPVWVIPYWTEAANLRRNWRSPWVKADDLLHRRQQFRRDQSVAASRSLIDEVYNNLASLPWAGTIRGFSDEEPVHKLATYATHNWLSTVHEHQMLDLLRVEIRLDPTRPRIIIKDTAFPHMLHAAYEQRDTGYCSDNRYFDPLREIGVDMGNGTHKELQYLMNLYNEHWVAVVLDFENLEILYGDSMGGEPSEDLKEILSWWTHIHSGRKFTYGELEITLQRDGFSCGLLAWNALAHRSLPHKHALIDAQEVDDARLKVMLKVIDRHNDRVRSISCMIKSCILTYCC